MMMHMHHTTLPSTTESYALVINSNLGATAGTGGNKSKHRHLLQ